MLQPASRVLILEKAGGAKVRAQVICIELVVARKPGRLLQQRLVAHPGHRGLPLRRVLVARVVQATALGLRALYSREGTSSTLELLPLARLRLRPPKAAARDRRVVLATPARDCESFPLLTTSSVVASRF